VVAHYLSLKYNLQFSHGIRAPNHWGPCFRINLSHLNCGLFCCLHRSFSHKTASKYCSPKRALFTTVDTIHCALFTVAKLFNVTGTVHSCNTNHMWVTIHTNIFFLWKKKEKIIFSGLKLDVSEFICLLRAIWHQSICQKK
jgi:hypothetical protein